MSDWRLNGQEAYLSNAILYKITFPEFWKHAYESKNPFYQKIAAYANDYVERTGQCTESLEGEKVQHFWHEHCEFCWEKAVTYEPATFYCTKDLYRWICAECFEDFCGQFQWQVKSAEALFDQKYQD